MAKIKNIYDEKVETINISEIINKVYPSYDWKIKEDLEDEIKKVLDELDFNEYDYMFVSNSYWCGILTAVPFNEITENRSEEDVLNLIKEFHTKIEIVDGEYIIRFVNPSKSPLYRFFNKYKKDGYGWNVPYSINGCFQKIQEYLEKEIANSEAFAEFNEDINYED